MENQHTTMQTNHNSPNISISNRLSNKSTVVERFRGDQEDDAHLQNEFRYIFTSMAIFGLYRTPKRWTKPDQDKPYQGVSQLASRFYCLLIILLMIVNVARTLAGFLYLDARTLAMQFTYLVYWSIAALNSIIWYRICCTDKLPNIFDLWQCHCQSSEQSRIFATSLSSSYVRRTRNLIFGVAFSGVVGNFLFVSFMRFGPIESLRNDTISAVAPATDPIIVWEILNLISTIFANAAWFLPPAFFLTLCILITKQFQQFTDKFHQRLTDESKFKGCLMSLRRQHQYLSKFVFALDDVFNFYLTTTFGMLMLAACFLMYQLVVARNLSSFYTTVLCVLWMMILSTKFAAMGMITANVNEKAHEIVNYIHDIAIFGFKQHEEVTQMNMFMAKLNGPSIALSLWGIVPVTKEFLLTILGVYVTYFALVAQTF